MAFFKSKREKRLWLWTLLVLGCIYASIFWAYALLQIVTEDGIAAIFFLLGMFLVAVMILTHGLQSRPKGLEITIGLGLTAVFVMLFLRLNMAERSHLIEYGVLAVFIYAALKEGQKQGRRIRYPAIFAILLTAILGWVDEGIQYFVPNRVYDIEDVVFNSMAALSTVGASLILGKIRQRFKKAE